MLKNLLGKMDMLDMVPAGTIQDLAREHGGTAVLGLLDMLRDQYGCQPGERVSMQLIEHVRADGTRTALVLPMVLNDQYQVLRKLPYYDLLELLQKAPIAALVQQAKAVQKALGKLQPIMEKALAASTKGDTRAVEKHMAAAQALLAGLPPAVANAVAKAMMPEPPAKPEPAQLPAAETRDTNGPEHTSGEQP